MVGVYCEEEDKSVLGVTCSSPDKHVITKDISLALGLFTPRTFGVRRSLCIFDETLLREGNSTAEADFGNAARRAE